MKLIIHRVNTIKKLRKIPEQYGVEIDIRCFGKKLILSHDPYKNGDNFIDYLKYYSHSLLVANIKEAGIENDVIKLLRKANIKDFFLLDVEFPYLYKSAIKGQKNIAIRFSEKENIDNVKKFTNK